jgi:hypothetical protein
MKYFFQPLLFLYFLFLTLCSYSQDVVITIKGEEFTGKVTEITLDDVFLRNDSLIAIPVKYIFMIKYANGTSEVFAEHLDQPTSSSMNMISSSDYFMKGMKDAKIHYKGEGAFFGTSAATVCCIPVASVILIANSSDKVGFVAQIPANIDPSLRNNPDYIKGYSEGVKKKKLKNTVQGHVTGIGILITLYIGLIYISSQLQ